MNLILIHWKIIPNQIAVSKFFHHWSEILTIPDRTGLIGEFLSEPISPEATGLFFNGIALHNTPEYFSFVNIGLWKNIDAFKEQIDRPYRIRGLSKLDFEYEKCQGILLRPVLQRAGFTPLPTADQLEPMKNDWSEPT